MEVLSYYLCGIDGKGRAVRRHERKTFRGIDRLAKRYPGLFIVTRLVANDGKEDHGTVYFFDLSGTQVEVANA